MRDYKVYIPPGGGSRAGTVRTIANLLLVWLLTGIWHGANWTFLLWGRLLRRAAHPRKIQCCGARWSTCPACCAMC